MTRRPVPALGLIAPLLAELRRRGRPVKGKTLRRVLRADDVRRVQEAVHTARCRGWRIVSTADGYALARNRGEVQSFVRRELRRISREARAIRGVERGRTRQTTIAATRNRRRS